MHVTDEANRAVLAFQENYSSTSREPISPDSEKEKNIPRHIQPGRGLELGSMLLKMAMQVPRSLNEVSILREYCIIFLKEELLC